MYFSIALFLYHTTHSLYTHAAVFLSYFRLIWTLFGFLFVGLCPCFSAYVYLPSVCERLVSCHSFTHLLRSTLAFVLLGHVYELSIYLYIVGTCVHMYINDCTIFSNITASFIHSFSLLTHSLTHSFTLKLTQQTNVLLSIPPSLPSSLPPSLNAASVSRAAQSDGPLH